MTDFLKLSDLTAEELDDLLNLAAQLKEERRRGVPHPILAGKSLGMIFEKSSTRTRVSFEAGIYQLGGQGQFLSSRDLQIGRGEPIEDTARVLSRYLDGIMIRTFKQETVETLAKYATIPVINALTDYAHPCQVVADLLTVREYKGSTYGKKLAFIGDGNNMANSLIVGGLLAGMEVAIACPKGYEPHPSAVAFGDRPEYRGKLTVTESCEEAATGADVLYTDVWASMGQEEEAAVRRAAFNGYQINEELMKHAKQDALVLHCLPAHREEEITAETFEKHAAEIFDEAENRLHAHKAIMVRLMAD